MLTAQLTGGLGNQLFTYARLALHANELSIPLLLDGSISERVLGQTPDLFDFKLMNEDQIHASNYGVVGKQIERALWRTRATQKLTNRYQTNLLGNQNELPREGQNWKVRGFFQDFNVAHDFIKTFSKKPFLLKAESDKLQRYSSNIQNKKTLAIHMRRGDYLNYKESFGVLSDRYYFQALHAMTENVDIGQILIFTDSPDLVDGFGRDLSLPAEIVSPKDLSTSENMILMSRCDALITSNSTYSFWAAIFADHKNTIAPYPWFRSEDDWLNSSNLNNPEWINCKSLWMN